MQHGNAAETAKDDGVVGATRITGDNSGGNAVAADGGRGASTANVRYREVAATVRRIIEEWKRPMKGAELREQVTKYGHLIEGSDPETVLSSILWRAGDAAGVVRLRRGDGYWLKERPWQPSGYDPTDEKLAIVRRALANHFE